MNEQNISLRKIGKLLENTPKFQRLLLPLKVKVVSLGNTYQTAQEQHMTGLIKEF